MTCPYGDDPDTLGQVDDQQIISCTYLGGSNAQTTVPLSPLATTAQVKAALTARYLRCRNKENIECSGRGLCDHITGECSCFTGFGSSDGKSGSGTKRDCGYLEPLASMSG
eukprot:gene23087-29913_t